MRNRYRRFMPALLLVLAIMAGPAAAVAPAAEEQRLDEVSVTATRVDRKTSQVPASISVVGKQAIQDTEMSNVKEALTGIPGVLIESPNRGYDARVIIRGAGLKARYGVRDVMVMLDGVPITDPDGLSRLDFVDTQLIRQVEVVKGPNSTLWGANAAGGVINIMTQSPFERAGGVAKIGLGGFGTQSYHLGYSGNLKEALYYSLSGSHRQTDNSWRRWNTFETTQGNVQSAVMFDDGTTLETYLGITSADLQLPGKLNESQFRDYEDSGLAPESDGPWQFSGRYSDIAFLSSKLNKEFGDFEFKPMVYFNAWRHHHPVTARINDADTLSLGTDIQLDYRHRLLGGAATLTGGLTGRWDNQDTDYYKYLEYTTTPGGRIIKVLSDRPGGRIERQSRRVSLYGAYMQESFKPHDKWLIDLGLRYDFINFDITGTRTEEYSYAFGRYAPAGDPAPIDKNFKDFSPRLGVTYTLNRFFNLFVNLSKGIQTPTEGELSENPDLDLVAVQNYELGLKGRDSWWAFDTSIYFSPVKNDVTQVVAPGFQTTYVNAGETHKKGFEFAGTVFLPRGFEVGGGYAYCDYTFDAFSEPVRQGGAVVNVDRSGNQLPFIPRHQYSVFGGYRHASGFKCRVSANTWGAYYIDNANSEKYGGYELITQLMAGYDWGPLELQLNVSNLFNAYYALEVQKDTSGKKTYNPAAPRSFLVQLKYNFF